MRACVRASVRACVCACVRACVCACVYRTRVMSLSINYDIGSNMSTLVVSARNVRVYVNGI